jgi:hypothetical protein
MVTATKATKVRAVSNNKPAAKKVAAPTKKASVLAREAQAAKKRLLKLRADTKKAIEAAKREVAHAVEAARSALRFEKQAAKDKLAAKKAKAAGARKATGKAAATKAAPTRMRAGWASKRIGIDTKLRLTNSGGNAEGNR